MPAFQQPTAKARARSATLALLPAKRLLAEVVMAAFEH
jgi:hypothetical protein